MSEEKCSNCRFWELFDQDDGGDDDRDAGTCRRYPHKFVGPSYERKEGESLDPQTAAIGIDSWLQPTSAGGDWCGEWQRVRIPRR